MVSSGEQIEIGPFRLETVPAAHERLGRDCVGYVIRFGPWAVYHSGDTLFHDAIVERVRPHRVDVAILPINGRVPERRVDGNLNGTEAARLGKQIAARTVIPCHYEMFTFNTADPAEFSAACGAIGQPCHIIRCGERWDSRSLDV